METITGTSNISTTFKPTSLLAVKSSLKRHQFFSIEWDNLGYFASVSTSSVGKRWLATRSRNFWEATPPSILKGAGSIRKGMLQHIRAKVDNLDRSLADNEFNQQSGLSLTAELEKLEQFDVDVDIEGFHDLSTVGAAGRVIMGNDAQVSTECQSGYQPRVIWFAKSEKEEIQYIDRAINASIAGAAGVFAIAKVVTVDHNYWHGWTIFEILKYLPVHNWSAYEDALNNNPVLAKMMISGIVYSVGDWIAQCYEGKPILDFNRARMLRSGFVGFCLHGSLSHFYYHLCEDLFPFKDWWVVPLKVAFDQTIWSGIWNSIYFVTLGLLRLESPNDIFPEFKATFLPMLTAGWKLWPFAHIITYGVVPVEQRLLWVDCVELIWVTILSMYSNKKAEARILGTTNELAEGGMMASEAQEGSNGDNDK